MEVCDALGPLSFLRCDLGTPAAGSPTLAHNHLPHAKVMGGSPGRQGRGQRAIVMKEKFRGGINTEHPEIAGHS